MTIDSRFRSNPGQDICRRALAALGRAVRRVADILPRWHDHGLTPVHAVWTVTSPEDALRRWEAR